MQEPTPSELATLAIAASVTIGGLGGYGAHMTDYRQAFDLFLIFTGLSMFLGFIWWHRYYAKDAIFGRFLKLKIGQMPSLHGKQIGPCWENHDGTRDWFDEVQKAFNYALKPYRESKISHAEEMLVGDSGGLGPQRPRRLLEKENRSNGSCSLCQEFAEVERILIAVARFVNERSIREDFDGYFLSTLEGGLLLHKPCVFKRIKTYFWANNF